MMLKSKTSLMSAALAVGIISQLVVSCSPSYMRKSADNEVRNIFFWKSKAAPNSGAEALDILPPPAITLEALKKNSTTADFLGDRATVEKKASVIPLSNALGMAVTHNRAYRDQKESLFLQALSLTLTQHQFAPIFTSTGSSTIASTQTPQALQTQINTLVTGNTFTASSNTGVSVLTSTGARLAANFTTDFLRFISGNLTKTSDSTLAFTLTQPLLRGAGYRATMENLTQAERDLMYAVRTFTQYRKAFTVDITSRYYRTLAARDIARNAHFAYKAFEALLASQTALANNDRIKLSQLGQIQQASLKYKSLWIASVRAYEQSIDDLKIALGVPVSEPIILDEKELSKLELLDPSMTLEQATQTALVTRLDLDNARNSIEDSIRQIKIAEQNFLPQLDITGGYSVVAPPNSTKPTLNFDRRNLGASANLDLRLDKKADRNNYRAALIHQQKAERDLDLAEENVRSDIRADWRDLDVARKQYQIAQTSMELSTRRLDYENTLRELGQGTARDLIEAQQDLIVARDAITAALISHTLARLKLWKDMGVLFIRKDGSWVSVLNKAELLGHE